MPFVGVAVPSVLSSALGFA